MNSYTRRTGPKKKLGSTKQPKISQPSYGRSAGANWKSNQLSRNVFEIVVEHKRRADWEYWCLLTSDRHWDNPNSDRELQLKHLKEAKERNASILDFGDLFCAMQGKYDKRSNKSAVRPEHNTDNYLDALVDTAAGWFAPYAKNIVVLGVGNHESGITNRVEVNLTDRLVYALNRNPGAHVYNGGFGGWVKFRFVEGADRGRTSIYLKYDHGYGGGGPVTKDIIQHQRRAVIFPDADIVVSGHTHDAFVAEFARSRLSEQGTVYQDIQTHIKTPTYKDDYRDGSGGWHAETGKPPKPLGGWWLRFFCTRKDGREDVGYEVIRAN